MVGNRGKNLHCGAVSGLAHIGWTVRTPVDSRTCERVRRPRVVEGRPSTRSHQSTSGLGSGQMIGPSGSDEDLPGSSPSECRSGCRRPGIAAQPITDRWLRSVTCPGESFARAAADRWAARGCGPRDGLRPRPRTSAHSRHASTTGRVLSPVPIAPQGDTPASLSIPSRFSPTRPRPGSQTSHRRGSGRFPVGRARRFIRVAGPGRPASRRRAPRGARAMPRPAWWPAPPGPVRVRRRAAPARTVPPGRGAGAAHRHRRCARRGAHLEHERLPVLRGPEAARTTLASAVTNQARSPR